MLEEIPFRPNATIMKVVSKNELAKLSAELKERGRRIVFTNGCFDILHPGHLHLLEAASRAGDVLIVGINDDRSVRRLKGEGRPVHNAGERVEMLLSIRWVDFVTVFDEDTPLETIKLLRPDVLAKGAEYAAEDIVGADLVRGWGGKVLRVAMKEGFSTSALLDRLKS